MSRKYSRKLGQVLIWDCEETDTPSYDPEAVLFKIPHDGRKSVSIAIT